MNWTNKHVLITGAGGFIGSHLTEKLVELGAQTKALVRYTSNGSRGWLQSSAVHDDIEFVHGDLRDRDSLRRAMHDVHTIFHLGALIAIPYSYDAPSSYVATNITGTLNVLEMARDHGINRIVHTSTSEVYGTARYVPIDEKHPLQGQSPYSATKIAADKLAEAFYLSFGVRVSTVRPFNTYGPRQSARAVVPTIVSQALAQNEIKLGSLDPTRDLNFVGDIVDGFIAAAASDAAIGETINLGQGKEISIGELARLICSITGRDLPIISDDQRVRPKNSEVERLCCNNSKARELIGWTPRHTLREGLEKSIAWIRENLEAYRIGEYTK